MYRLSSKGTSPTSQPGQQLQYSLEHFIQREAVNSIEVHQGWGGVFLNWAGIAARTKGLFPLSSTEGSCYVLTGFPGTEASLISYELSEVEHLPVLTVVCTVLARAEEEETLPTSNHSLA